METDKSKPTGATVKNLEVSLCKRCGRLFKMDVYESELCPNCLKIDEDDFEKVREYLYEHNTATAIEISEQTDVDITQIERYLKNGRLEIPENSPIFIKCEMCGADIRSGRLCSACSIKMSNATRIQMHITDSQIGETPKKSKDKSSKMYYFDNRRKS